MKEKEKKINENNIFNTNNSNSRPKSKLNDYYDTNNNSLNLYGKESSSEYSLNKSNNNDSNNETTGSKKRKNFSSFVPKDNNNNYQTNFRDSSSNKISNSSNIANTNSSSFIAEMNNQSYLSNIQKNQRSQVFGNFDDIPIKSSNHSKIEKQDPNKHSIKDENLIAFSNKVPTDRVAEIENQISYYQGERQNVI